jgi:cellulose synthase operon protein C
MKNTAPFHVPAAVLYLSLALLALPGCGGGSAEKDLVASAKAYLDKKDSKAAVIQLKNALQKTPQSGELRYLLGKALLESGDPVGAAVELRKAQELKHSDDAVLPELARVMLMLGEQDKVLAQMSGVVLTDPTAMADLKTTLAATHVIQGDTTKARESTIAALQAKPMFAPAVILQARLKANEKDVGGALFLLDEVLGREPGNDRAGVLKGEILWQAKSDQPGALAAFRKVLEAQPNSLAAHTAVISILFEQKKTDEARAQFAKLKAAVPNHPETWFYEAQIAFLDKDYKGTRELTERILKVMPDGVRVLELAGAAELRQQSYLQAEAHLGRALKLAPGQLVSRHLLAQTYLRAAQPNKAIEVLQPVLDTASADGVSLALAGEAYLQMGDAKRSDAVFKRAAKAAPNDTRVRTTVAMAQMALGNSSVALGELETIAAGDKGPRADLAIISAKVQKNDLEGALKAIATLEKKIPERALAYNLRGRLQLLKRDTAGATASFHQALSKEPRFFPAVASLAALELAAGKQELARQRLQDFIKAEPKSHQAVLALADITARSGGTPQEVMQLMNQAVKVAPNEPTPRLMLINKHLVAGDTKAALVAAQDASAALPNNLDIMEVLGRAQLASGDGQQAISTLKKLSGLQPTEALHHVRLADAHVMSKDNEAAALSLRKALEIKPDLAVAKRGLVALSLMDKRPQEGLAVARAMQQKDAKSATGFTLEGDVEASRKNWDAALAAYRASLTKAKSTETAVKIHAVLTASGKRADADSFAASWMKDNARDPSFRYYLGDVALGQKDFALAESHYRAVLDAQPRNALALNNVAWLMVKQSKPGAVALAEQATKIMPNRAPLLDTLATALAAENQLPRAIETQKKALATNPNDASLRLNLAKHYLQSGDKAQAKAELETLSKLGDKFPGQAEVAALLKTV